MSKGIYYKIDCDECRQLGLSGTDKDVYFFIKSFKNGLTMGQERIAEHLCTTSRTLRSSIDRLQRKGLIKKSASEYMVNGGIVQTYEICKPTEKFSEGYGKKFPQGTEKSSEGYGKKFPQGTEKFSEGTPYINTNNKQVILTSNIQGDAPEEKISTHSLVLMEWNSHYERHFNTGYVPDYRSLTNDANAIADAVEKKMADFGKNKDFRAEVEEFIRDMFEAMFSAADKWQREHWTLHTVATQFNQLYNTIINGNNNSNSNSGISRDYLERKMREAAGIV